MNIIFNNNLEYAILLFVIKNHHTKDKWPE